MDHSSTPGRRQLAGIATMGLALAALFALHALTLDLEDYWYDELFTWNVAAMESPGAIWTRLSSDTSPPLYFWALHYWQPAARQFGLSWRWVSVAGALLGVLGFFFWMRRGFGEGAALISAILLAFSPFWIQYGQELRMYSVYPAMLWWGAYFLVRAIESRRKVEWAAAAALNAAALWTHYHAAFFVLAEFAALSLIWHRQSGESKSCIRRGAIMFASLFLLGVAPLLALIPYQFSSSLPNISWLQFPKLGDIVRNYVLDYTYFSTSSQPVWGHIERMLALSFYVLLVTGVYFTIRRRLIDRRASTPQPHDDSGKMSNALILLLCAAFIPPVLMIILSFLPVKFYTPGRYAILSLAPYLGCLALLIIRAIDWRFFRALLIVLLIVLNVISAWQILGTRHKPTWSSFANAVDKRVGADDLLLGFPDFWFNGFELYLERPVKIQDFREMILSEAGDAPTSHVYALVFNLAAPEDTWHPWKVIRFMEMNSTPRRVYWDPWHTLLRFDDLNLAELRRWYLLRGQAGRGEVLAWNPLLFIGAEDLPAWLPKSKYYETNFNPAGELSRWLVDPPIHFRPDLTLETGSYTITMKARFRWGADPPPARVTLRLDGIPIQTFVIEEEGAIRLTARANVRSPLVNPLIELDGTTFRPIESDPAAKDENRLMMEFCWMAVVKDVEPSVD